MCHPSLAVPRSCSLTTRQQTTFKHLGSDWHLRVLAWRIIGGVEWSEWSELRQMQIWMIDSASIFAPHCRQAEANFQYLYGTNSPHRVCFPPRFRFSLFQTPRQFQSSPVLHPHSNLPSNFVELRHTEHLRGRRACFLPPRTSIVRLPIQYTAGRSPTLPPPEITFETLTTRRVF
jgi:hypothetical protein